MKGGYIKKNAFFIFMALALPFLLLCIELLGIGLYGMLDAVFYNQERSHYPFRSLAWVCYWMGPSVLLLTFIDNASWKKKAVIAACFLIFWLPFFVATLFIINIYHGVYP